jgi:GDPmannose 4,6-dehydratase
VELAFATVDLDWKSCVKRDERLVRAADSQSLVGDPSKAESILGWQREYRFPDIIREMTLAEVDALKKR